MQTRPTRFALTEVAVLTNTDCEGLAVIDVDGDGKLDLITSQSTGDTDVRWYKQGATLATADWTLYTIFAGGTKIEWVAAEVINGTLIVISADQLDGILRLHHAADPTSTWTTASLLTSRPYLHDAVFWDIDGDGVNEIVYSWEGNAAGLGGIGALKFTGGDPRTPANWTDYTLYQQEGSWGLCQSGFVDVDGDGNSEILYSARKSGRNAAQVPGVHYLKPPVGGPLSGTWTRTVINSEVLDWVHIDIGDFSGDGNGRDILCQDQTNAGDSSHRYFRASESWTYYRLKTLERRGFNRKAVKISPSLYPHLVRDAFLSCADGTSDGGTTGLLGGLYIHEAGDYTYGANRLFEATWNHPMDGPQSLVDLDGDGVLEWVIPDSSADPNTSGLRVFRVAVAPEESRPGDWSFKKQITVSHANIDADLAHFPLVVKFVDDADVGASALATGYDIRFTADEAGTQTLAYARKAFSVTGGEATGSFIVRVPSLLAASDSSIWMWYGNADAQDGQFPADVYNPAEYVAVYPLDEAPHARNKTLVDDITNHSQHLAPRNSVGGTPAAALLGNGYDLNGTNHYWDKTSGNIRGWATTTTRRVEIIFKPDAVDSDQYLMSSGNLSGNRWWLHINASGQVEARVGGSALFGATAIAAGDYHLCALEFDGANARLRVNGTQTGSVAATTVGTTSHYVGSFDGTANYFNGIIDEVRYLKVTRSAAWDKFMSANLASSELSFGLEQTTHVPARKRLTLRTASGAIHIKAVA